MPDRNKGGKILAEKFSIFTCHTEKAEFQEVAAWTRDRLRPPWPLQTFLQAGHCVRNTHPWDIVQISAITSGVHKEKPRSWYTGTS